MLWTFKYTMLCEVFFLNVKNCLMWTIFPPDLVSQKIEVKLNRRSCMQDMLRIIGENTPEVRSETLNRSQRLHCVHGTRFYISWRKCELCFDVLNFKMLCVVASVARVLVGSEMCQRPSSRCTLTAMTINMEAECNPVKFRHNIRT